MKLSKLLFATLLTFTVVSGAAHAEAISSVSVMNTQHSLYNKHQILEMVSREEVQTRLVELGVDQTNAIARINAMTDAEINSLNTQFNDAPAGGIVGAIITVLVVIALLDVLGVTDVYPFIRPIN